MKNIKCVVVLASLFLISSSGFAQASLLTSSEQEDILFMLEEEKMARDVYLAYQDKWDITVFKHISEAEQRHVDWLVALADDEGIWYPEALVNNKNGVFVNKEIQKMYDDFIKEGSASLENALQQGAKLEEVDIKDLRDRIAKTKNNTILNIYTRLENASNHHLQAFVKQLKKQGVDYQPIILDQATYNEVMQTTKGANAEKACCSSEGKSKNNKACCTGNKNNKNKTHTHTTNFCFR